MALSEAARNLIQDDVASSQDQEQSLQFDHSNMKLSMENFQELEK